MPISAFCCEANTAAPQLAAAKSVNRELALINANRNWRALAQISGLELVPTKHTKNTKSF
jgi:hypothetical protein